MESQNFGHEHPLVLMFNEEAQSNQSEASPTQYCSRCGEKMSSGPSFGCAEECGFYLHKECAEAPSQIHHPFHRDHPLCLLTKPPANYSSGRFICDFCGEEGKTFDYNCSSCDLDFHIKCALFTYNLAEKRVGEFKPIAFKDPSICAEELGNAKCFGCWEPLVDSIYCSLDCGFNLHQKCADLPFQIGYPGHRKHPLILQFSSEIFPCVICQGTERGGFFYSCSLCNFVIHIACLSPPSIIEDKGHQHPFTLFFRQFLFTCDACGIEGNCFPYMCSNCNLLLHKTCISLPRIIKFMWHEHPIFHTYFLEINESESWDCVLCLKKVNTEHGSYSCSDCHFIVHVNCVLRREEWYYVIEPDKILDYYSALLSDVSMDSFTVVERNKDGKATEIKHFSHLHNLMMSDKVVKDDKYCDGCTFSISGSFYHCSQCDFFLHKICAELPKKKHDWFHECQKHLILISDHIFKCCDCEYLSNGFAYKCEECKCQVCMRCSKILDTVTCEGHEHPLSFYVEYKGQCSACGVEIERAYKCKECNFGLCWDCLGLPCTTRHKCDEHLLTLAYHDNDTYSKRHFCDICEEDRNPNRWFYYCAICDTSVHTECVLGRYPFMKLGKKYEFKDHPHPLTLVKKMYYYPQCSACDKPCLDLALECQEPRCEYIIHWDCFGSSSGLRE
ncbi:hypothetical protein PTKIN_Ptkin02bG0048700 [Pterospermum kingtungense]